MDAIHDLVTAAGSGDVDAYGQLVRRFQNIAFGFACSILGDAQLAEDAVQEAFVEAFNRRGISSIRTPFRVICVASY